MRLVKLDAIPSTNDFLKELAADQAVENFTVVVAETQTKGRGQMGSTWLSQPGQNLTFSVFIGGAVADVSQIFNLNVVTSMAVFDALARCVSNLAVKWPNDIMAGEKKLGGILIENSIKGSGAISSVIGIGLNINQTDFNNLQSATSIKLVTGKTSDKDEILNRIVHNLQENVKGDYQILKSRYEERLFRKDVISQMKDASGHEFSGIISGVSDDGRLKVESRGETLLFSTKEVTLVY